MEFVWQIQGWLRAFDTQGKIMQPWQSTRWGSDVYVTHLTHLSESYLSIINSSSLTGWLFFFYLVTILWKYYWYCYSFCFSAIFPVYNSRLLFVNKAVAASYLKSSHTCIVIDSGCFNTVTSIIIDHEVSPELIHRSAIGGNTVTEHLLENIQTNYPNKYFDIVSLDRMQVKNSCHIPYLLSLDEKRRYECKVKVKSCCR